MTTMPTIEEIQQMTPEEVAALNKQLARKLGKKILTRVAVVTAVSVGVHLVINKLTASDDTIEIDTVTTEI